MKFILFLMASFLGTVTSALANPACVVCTVAIGASLEIAQKLGIDDNVVGLWAGAMFALLGYWAILWFEKKKWNFWGRNFLLMFCSLASIGFLYLGNLIYSPKIIVFLYIDPFLFASLIGAALYIATQKLYQWMKEHNDGHAHFPFEKVVLPVVCLFIASVVLTYYPL
ncbi:MAG: hypothetical protein NC218_10040 [Acetobacter sp.]|nr:hypothetical protein [Acetobacter sp.]